MICQKHISISQHEKDMRRFIVSSPEIDFVNSARSELENTSFNFQLPFRSVFQINKNERSSYLAIVK